MIHPAPLAVRLALLLGCCAAAFAGEAGAAAPGAAAPPSVEAGAQAPCTTLPRLGSVTASDGVTVAWIESDPSRMDEGSVEAMPHMNVCIVSGSGAPRLLVAGNAGADPTHLLVNFGALTFNTAGTCLYFSTDGWVTSEAAHGVEVATGREWFITDGLVIGEIDAGRYAGALVMAHYRLDDQHAIESPKYEGRMEMWAVVDPQGKELLRLPEDRTRWEALGVAPPRPGPVTRPDPASPR